MQGTELSCECFGAAALIMSLADLPAALEGLAAHVASSGVACGFYLLPMVMSLPSLTAAVMLPDRAYHGGCDSSEGGSAGLGELKAGNLHVFLTSSDATALELSADVAALQRSINLPRVSHAARLESQGLRVRRHGMWIILV